SGRASVHTSRDPRLNHVDWTDGRERIRDVVRALAPPLPGAYTSVRGHRLILGEVQPVGPEASNTPGRVELLSGNAVGVWTGDGLVEVISAESKGRRLRGPEIIEALKI